MEEKTLILAFKEGSETAFTSLYNLYCNRVYRFCKLYITQDAAAEEAMQEVFLKLWDIRSYVNENENLNGLLYIITRNIIFDHPKKYFNETFFQLTAIAAYEDSADIQAELEVSDLKKYIDQLIDELPTRQKEVFNLSRKEELSYKEIAERLNISPKTVERHINEALKHLRKNIYLLQLFISL